MPTTRGTELPTTQQISREQAVELLREVEIIDAQAPPGRMDAWLRAAGALAFAACVLALLRTWWWATIAGIVILSVIAYLREAPRRRACVRYRREVELSSRQWWRDTSYIVWIPGVTLLRAPVSADWLLAVHLVAAALAVAHFWLCAGWSAWGRRRA